VTFCGHGQRRMNQDVVILIVAADEGRYSAIGRNLYRAGLFNEMVHFADGEMLGYLSERSGSEAEPKAYVVLLDTGGLDGDSVEILRSMKAHEALKRVPVIILAEGEDPEQMERCHEAGCALYVVKPSAREELSDAIRKIGQFLSIVSVPKIGEAGH